MMAGMALSPLSWASRISSRSPYHFRESASTLCGLAGAKSVHSLLICASIRNYCSSPLSPGPIFSRGSRYPQRKCSTLVSTPMNRNQVVPLSWTSSGRRLLSTEPPSGRGNDDKNQDNTPTSKTARLLSRIPLPVHENIYTIPNILTFSRLAAAPVIGYCILHWYDIAALSLFAYASVTDLVDGYIARKFNQQTVVGTVIDPMADKALMTIGVICLALKSAIPVWLAGLILARDVGLAISAIYYRWISLPPPKTMARYWDFSLPSAEVKPTAVSKANTALQLLLVGSAMAMPVVPEAISSAWSLHEGMTGLQYIVAGTTVWSGASYIYSKDAVKILTAEEIEKRAELKRNSEEDTSNKNEKD
ncbi:CDP-diacylglycerol-glycerol-3-phosphate 3-phosphatidyltransferase, variant [Blastomyces gilchristii SLH14081]|uniref:CDP-diacylglycerol-glycerol-3-phosphate 3-phosphatidyltransferase n=1 Tax=Blastomyces gilchristii (strain SLH14081) TaxID=559298 RepID=A0A179UZ94_BLAGS|nr:CDP-diacylglycerol-glycerol-3-phosphate 3-phosphatidyltransferase [Blastomyces gilchristii SLH14081]XP_031580348.1 CDP-diacylglycerol-glycerol-3-phosphate 3-phosphatidyltransferase, variant [Blastomyces gilchristii SLH14081]OAT12371.1 CDP-diacylglycerol-glycerol-3-phosphate 3-phosphatidyltransferase [Blastomyces gilchristii SLH14081]OAT12372.1 CDP-diacylglycerol-glycerol-3-phosphate 3-phosphatidyltransferase, variant [Blastomyces gilchristii SLH14081]